MAKKKEPVEIVVVLDRSGSMRSIAEDAIGGFNTFLEEQKKVKGKANITLALFDHEYQEVYDSADIQSAENLTKTTYVPRGFTGLLDAIGRSITKLESKNPKKAIVCILTDGQENASKEFSNENIKELLKKCEDRGWQVMYLAANQDAFAVGAQYGFSANLTKNFDATARGVSAAYTNCSIQSTSYRSS